ncbi:hypothetical protein MDA_GLEAN10017934 [Myotis davidii]|uniref:Membrane-anchored junction protein n=1 Tax=Myotis davidii TaxID=225400 RepID=L5LFE3_MYODS|nr:hypothetical protein MDA_GLEAN10017934 [Myotis davidii]
MSLKPFTYPFPETRFLHSGSSVYKFKIRYGDSISGSTFEAESFVSTRAPSHGQLSFVAAGMEKASGEMEGPPPSGALGKLTIPTTAWYLTSRKFNYKSKWERVSHLKFKHGEIVLIPYPFVLTLYVELKWFNENLSTGKRIDDSPLGLVPAERKAARAMKKRKRVELSVSPSRPGLDRATMRTSSQGPSKKKFLMETSRVSTTMEASKLLTVPALLQSSQDSCYQHISVLNTD